MGFSSQPFLALWAFVWYESAQSGPQSALILSGEWSPGSRLPSEAELQRLESSSRPTAIFTMNDMMAMQAMKATRLVGLSVPEDLSLVGFDDEGIVNTLLDVPLTMTAQNAVTLGRRAAELLIERIDGYDGPPRGEVVPTELRVRASTGPPRAIKSQLALSYDLDRWEEGARSPTRAE